MQGKAKPRKSRLNQNGNGFFLRFSVFIGENIGHEASYITKQDFRSSKYYRSQDKTNHGTTRSSTGTDIYKNIAPLVSHDGREYKNRKNRHPAMMA
jgi:hypothetical protein